MFPRAEKVSSAEKIRVVPVKPSLISWVRGERQTAGRKGDKEDVLLMMSCSRV